MSVDEQIREQLQRTSAGLPEPDTAAALESVLSRAGAAHRRRGVLTGVAASAAVVATVLVGTSLLDADNRDGELLPAGPAATTGAEELSADADDRLTRPRDTSAMPVERLLGPAGAAGTAQIFRWEDGGDATLGGSDVDTLRVSWDGTTRLDGREYPAQGVYLDLLALPADDGSALGREVEYGIVLDRDGDRVADCELGVRTTLGAPSEFRSWRTRLATGSVHEQVGSREPYEPPFEFHDPLEQRKPVMEFIFGNPWPECHSASQGRYFYVWAATLEDGEVVDIDFAPDAAWLETPELLRAEPSEEDW